MMPPENTTQVQFSIKKGTNISDRIVLDLLELIAEKLNKTTIEYQGKTCSLKTLGEVKKNEEGRYRLIFDVKNPVTSLAHVEFTIEKTGWEICLINEESND